MAVQYYCEIKLVHRVPHTVFIPEPGVESAVIRLSRRQQPKVAVKDEHTFFELVKACFAQRRKTLLNNLQTWRGKEHKEILLAALSAANIDPTRRAETLHIEEFAELYRAILRTI